MAVLVTNVISLRYVHVPVDPALDRVMLVATPGEPDSNKIGLLDVPVHVKALVIVVPALATNAAGPVIVNDVIVDDVSTSASLLNIVLSLMVTVL